MAYSNTRVCPQCGAKSGATKSMKSRNVITLFFFQNGVGGLPVTT